MKETKFIKYDYARKTVNELLQEHAKKVYGMTGIEARRYIAKKLPCVSKQIISEEYAKWREFVMNNPIKFKTEYAQRIQIHTNMEKKLKAHLVKCQEMNGFSSLNEYVLHLLKEGSNYEG